jgi:heptosyltransferase-2
VIVGTSADAAVAAGIAEGFAIITDLTGKTSLEELMHTLCGMSVLLTNDTGTMHLADFLGVPLVAIFGSTEPSLTGPRGPASTALRHQVECSPCFLRECPLDFRCMKEIKTDDVVSALLRCLPAAK